LPGIGYIAKRRVTYQLNVPKGVRLKKGILRAEFRQPKKWGGKVVGRVEKKIP